MTDDHQGTPRRAPSAGAAPGTHYRQGDVLLYALDRSRITSELDVVPRRDGRIVLAEGEATGHAHAVHDAGATLLRARRPGGPLLLRLDAPAVVVHEEHTPLELPAGDYAVVLQREYVPPAVSPAESVRVRD